MVNYSSLLIVFLVLLHSFAVFAPARGQGTCPIPDADVGEYVANDPNVFSTRVRAQYQSTGGPSGGVLVTWQLTYPACVQFLCVKIELAGSRRDGLLNTCLDDTSITSVSRRGLPCNINVRASVILSTNGRGRTQQTGSFYLGGNPSLPPSIAPPNFRTNLDNGELLLRWSVMECTLQNSPILHYLIQYSATVVTGSGRFLTVNGTTTEIRSSSTMMIGQLYIPDLTQCYEFTVAACRAVGQCGPTALLNVVPANQSPVPTLPPSTTLSRTTQSLPTNPPTTCTPQPTSQSPSTPTPTTPAPPTTRTTTDSEASPTATPDDVTMTQSSPTGGNNLTKGDPNTNIDPGTTLETTTDLIVVNASKTYLTSDDEEGSRLSCAFAQRQDQGRGQLSWIKNRVIVAAVNASTLYLNTQDIKAQSVTTYGRYTCKSVDSNGRQFAQSLHIAEKASFSLQLRPTDDSLDCVRTSTNTTMQALISELRALLSQACDCKITPCHFTMSTMSCDANVLTLNSNLVYSNSDGNVTASTLLTSAASALMGVRIFNEERFKFDTSCPIRVAQEACEEGRAVMGVNQFTMLAISLLVIVCMLIGGAILTAVLLCALKLRRKKPSTHSYRDPIGGDHPLQQIRYPTQPPPVPPSDTQADTNTTEPQAYSYPIVSTIVGRRVMSNTGIGSDQVLTSPESNIHSGGMDSSIGQHTESPENVPNASETSFGYNSNPAFTVSTNENLHNSELYLNNIRQETTKPPGGAPTREHICDFPQFEVY